MISDKVEIFIFPPTHGNLAQPILDYEVKTLLRTTFLLMLHPVGLLGCICAKYGSHGVRRTEPVVVVYEVRTTCTR